PPDFLVDAAAGNEIPAGLGPVVIPHQSGRSPGLDRLRTGLENEQLAGTANLGPFQIHGCRSPQPFRVMGLDQVSPPRQGQDRIGRDHEPGAVIDPCTSSTGYGPAGSLRVTVMTLILAMSSKGSDRSSWVTKTRQVPSLGSGAVAWTTSPMMICLLLPS